MVPVFVVEGWLGAAVAGHLKLGRCQFLTKLVLGIHDGFKSVGLEVQEKRRLAKRR